MTRKNIVPSIHQDFPFLSLLVPSKGKDVPTFGQKSQFGNYFISVIQSSTLTRRNIKEIPADFIAANNVGKNYECGRKGFDLLHFVAMTVGFGEFFGCKS